MSYVQNLNITVDVIDLTVTWIYERNTNLYNMKFYAHKESYRKDITNFWYTIN